MRFVIAGPCHENSINELIRQAKAELPTLVYLGPVYGEAKKAFFRDIDVLLFPTNYVNEAQPLTIYEAFAAGIPVIARARGCIASMVFNGAGQAIPSTEPFADNAATTLEKWASQLQKYSAMANHLPDDLKQRQNEMITRLDQLQAEITQKP